MVGNKRVDVLLVGKEGYGEYRGQYNLPCGKREKYDCCSIGTAIRETREEVKYSLVQNGTAVGNVCKHPTLNSTTLLLSQKLPADFDISVVRADIVKDVSNPNWMLREMVDCDFVVISTRERVGDYKRRMGHRSSESLDVGPVTDYVKRICLEITRGQVKTPYSW